MTTFDRWFKAALAAAALVAALSLWLLAQPPREPLAPMPDRIGLAVAQCRGDLSLAQNQIQDDDALDALGALEHCDALLETLQR